LPKQRESGRSRSKTRRPVVGERFSVERSRLLLVWLQARRAVDATLASLLAAGPAGERRVRERFEVVERLEAQARDAFMHYRNAVLRDLFGSDVARTDSSEPDVTEIVDQDGKQAAPPGIVGRNTRP
jgi:hypothetical protein